ncbi:MAG: tetratricopeptide repeat protein [Candidatus Saccharibacteria bacterium]
MSDLVKDRRYSLAIHYYDIGHFDDAQDTLTQLLQDYPDSIELYYQLAWCQYQKDNYGAALDFCFKSIENGYRLEDVNYLAGIIYEEMGMFYEAEQCLLEALRLNPNNGEVHSRYGLLMQEAGFFEKADLLMKESIRLDPDNPSVIKDNYVYHFFAGEISSQLSLVQEYIDNYETPESKFMIMAIDRYVSKDYKGARDCYLEAYLMNPNNSDVLDLLKEVDYQIHPVFLLQRLLDRIGGLFAVFLTTMLFLTLAVTTKGQISNYFDRLASILAVFMVVYLMYVYLIGPILYKVVLLAQKRIRISKNS